ncbi:MAG: DNA cytosine methyltransferase [Methanomicrobiales archaeon]|nr:DNA cytosine methyltransferase [Methanomicrobiales archaeon]MDI6876294.1 DNA cytosine methyltransferase [Methanomicrobiales archaeon]
MKVLDLFCGAGGLSLGFRNEGFSVTGVDVNDWAGEIYLINDIGEFIQKDLAIESIDGSYEVIVGGPPCRPWSSVNVKRRGFFHPDYSLLEHFFAHILRIKPSVFLLENVPPLEGDIIYKNFKKTMYRAGYSISSKVINYQDYGVATSRKRLFTVGFRDFNIFGFDANRFFEKLTCLKEKPVTIEQVIKIYENLPEGDIPDHEWPKLKTIDKYLDHYEDGRYGWIKLSYKKSSPSFGNIMKTYILHPCAGRDGFPTRVISIREALAIMGFPSNFRFPEKMGMGMRYQMVANAVSPMVSSKLARVIKHMMKDLSFKHGSDGE